MKYIIFFFLLLSISLQSQAQVEMPSTTSTGSALKSGNVGNNSSVFSRLRSKPNETENIFMKKDEPEINMRKQDNGLLTEADRFAEKFKKDREAKEAYKEDQYLGDVSTDGKFVELYCRDHEFVDGDRVKITVNGEVLIKNLALTGGYRPLLITLKEGFNTIEFEALNQGTSGPNTAELKVYAEDGTPLVNQEWNLLTGAKASLMVVKK